jgi:hypothetical protein
MQRERKQKKKKRGVKVRVRGQEWGFRVKIMGVRMRR